MEVIKVRKIIFLDIDGTLVDYEGKVPESAVEAIKKARGNGHLVYLNTGRSKAELPTELLEIGFDGIIGGNGNYVEINGKVITHKLISLADEKRIVDWLEERKLYYYLESNSGLFGSRDFDKGALTAVRKYIQGKDETKDLSEVTVENTIYGLVLGQELYRDDINKISFVLNTYQDYLDAKKKFKNFEVGTWGGKDEQALFGDIRPKNISKDVAIDTLLDYLHESLENTIAFGDAKIDIPMFEHCNIGVAMGNAGQEAKDKADIVTSDVSDDGLKKAFIKLGLI